MPDKYKKRREMVKVKPIGTPSLSKTKKPSARLAADKKEGVKKLTYKGKDGRVYTTPGAKKRADMRYDASARKARAANPSVAKGSEAERELVKRRRALSK